MSKFSCKASKFCRDVIILYLQVFSILVLSAKNASVIVVKPSKGYIISGSDGGLANRLRVLTAYMHLAKFGYNADLIFIWDINTACPGHYLSLFEPIIGVTFASNTSRDALTPAAEATFPNNEHSFQSIMMENHVPKNRPGFIPWGKIELIQNGKITPLARIIKKANDYTIKNNICNCSSLHRRKTDLFELMSLKYRSHADHFYKFISTRPDDENIFLMTDNRKTQILFMEKYRKINPTNQLNDSRILIYDTIPPLPTSNTSGVLNNNIAVGGCTVTYSNLNGTVLPQCYRHTSLEHTLIDIIIASQAKIFKGTASSSLSELVNIFRRRYEYVKSPFVRIGIDLEILKTFQKNNFNVCPDNK